VADWVGALSIAAGASGALFAISRGLHKALADEMNRATGGHRPPRKRYSSREEWAAAQPDDLFDPPWHWKARRALGLPTRPLPPIVIPECGPVKPPPRPGVKPLADRPLRLGDAAIGGLPRNPFTDHLDTERRESALVDANVARFKGPRHVRPER